MIKALKPRSQACKWNRSSLYFTTCVLSLLNLPVVLDRYWNKPSSRSIARITDNSPPNFEWGNGDKCHAITYADVITFNCYYTTDP